MFAFVWKQTPFVALLVSDAMASLDCGPIESERNLGAGQLRILFVRDCGAAGVAHVADRPDSVFRDHDVGAVGAADDQCAIPDAVERQYCLSYQRYGDYGVANALGAISLLMTAVFAVIYLRISMRKKA
ncbi:MAG: hypothetical protein ACR5LF_06400 [Symbiopectobacterium sp.]